MGIKTPRSIHATAITSSRSRKLLRACRQTCIMVGYREDMPTPAPYTPTRAGGQSSSSGTSTEPATRGLVAAPRALTPIRKGLTPRARCCASSWITRAPCPCDRRQRPTEKPGTGTLTWKTGATRAMSSEAASSRSCPQAMRPRVVIVGAGFRGLWVAKTLANSALEVVVIDRQNYHLFQPLLYQVATAGLSPADIAAPIRSIVGTYRNITVMLGEVNGVDVGVRAVFLEGGGRAPYDYLVLATGARHAYFGHDDWEPFAPGLKRIEDATEIRRRILLAFERAENETDPVERRRLMNLVIVGGWPNGRRTRWRHRRAGQPRAGERFPQHRSARCAHCSGRGGTAPTIDHARGPFQ